MTFLNVIACKSNTLMKNSLRLIAMSVILFTACKKEETSIIPEAPTPPDTSYYIDGLTDIHAMSLGQIVTQIPIVKTTADHKKVNVSFRGFPPNVKTKAEYTSGYPDYIAYLTMNFRFTPAGTYPFTVITQAEGNPAKEYDINIIVDKIPESDCQYYLLSFLKWSNYDINSNSSTPIPQTLQPSLYMDGNLRKAYFNRLLLYHDNTGNGQNVFTSYRAISHNSRPDNHHVEVRFDCENGNITIPQQKVEGLGGAPLSIDTFTIAGSGKGDLNTEKYTITYTSTSSDPGKKSVQYTINGDFKEN